MLNVVGFGSGQQTKCPAMAATPPGLTRSPVEWRGCAAGGHAGRRSATRCKIPEHALVIASMGGDVTERGSNAELPHERATARMCHRGKRRAAPWLTTQSWFQLDYGGGGTRHLPQATRHEGSRPSRNSCRLSSTSMPMAVRVSKVALPRWGSSTALSSSSSSAGISGSPS